MTTRRKPDDPPPDDTADPARTTPQRLAAELVRLGGQLSKIALAVRAQNAHLESPYLRELTERIGAAAESLADVAGQVRVGALGIVAGLDDFAGEGRYPLIEKRGRPPTVLERHVVERDGTQPCEAAAVPIALPALPEHKSFTRCHDGANGDGQLPDPVDADGLPNVWLVHVPGQKSPVYAVREESVDKAREFVMSQHPKGTPFKLVPDDGTAKRLGLLVNGLAKPPLPAVQAPPAPTSAKPRRTRQRAAQAAGGGV